jgi:protein-L-isoaspartate(D-aspartate) O-methyltransferase
MESRRSGSDPAGGLGRRRGGRATAIAVLGLAAGTLLVASAMFGTDGTDPGSQDQRFAAARQRMVEDQIRRRGIDDPRVVAAMSEVPRHEFVPESERSEAYDDRPLPIGYGQTISQPYIVALMSQLAAVGPQSRVLEIGTGSGYHAAVMSRLAGSVYSVEIVEPLGVRASETLKRQGYDNVHVRIGDGYQGWPEEAPFDAILLTAAPPEIPQPLLDQLKVGGRMVVPVGEWNQDLQLVTKTAAGVTTKSVIPVRFVPMTGRAQDPR